MIHHQNRDTGADDRKSTRYEIHPALGMVKYGGSKKVLCIPFKYLRRNITVNALMISWRVTPEDDIRAAISLRAG